MRDANRLAVERPLPTSNIGGWFAGTGFFVFTLERFVEPRLKEFQVRIDGRLVASGYVRRDR